MTTSVILKTAKCSQGTPQAPGDATVLKKFFLDNFVIFHPRSKRIAFLESVIFLRVSLCKFSIFVMVTLQGPISPKCLVTDSPDYQMAHLQSLSFPSVPLVWVKLFSVGCAQDSRLSKSTLKRGKCCFWIWLRPRYKIPEFFTIAPVLTSTLTVCRRNRGDPSSLYRT